MTPKTPKKSEDQQVFTKEEKDELLLRLALTQRKLALTTQKLVARSQELLTIHRLSEVIGSERQINRLCERTVEDISRTLGVGMVSILLYDVHTGDLVTAASIGTDAGVKPHARVKPGDGLLWQVMRTGKPQQIAPARGAAKQTGLAVPVKSKGKAFGVIFACGKADGREFSARERSLLAGIANHAAMAIDNATLYHDLENLFVGIAWSFAAVLDAKSPWTAGHSKRVTQYAVAISEELGQGPEFLHAIQTSGLLHDIGKIAIPEQILDKPGAITRHEHESISEHPARGAKILEHIDPFQPFIPAIRHHHERWDGGGFPDGLKGQHIPLLARVLAVADSFDAITSDRPYRKKRGKADAIAEIRRCSGTQFDPDVVEAFAAAIGRRK